MAKRPGKAASMFQRFFPKRSVIILSNQNVNHIPVSGKFQALGLVVALMAVGGGSFFTGGYMAAQKTLAEQDKTIKSVATAQVEKTFGFARAGGTPFVASSHQARISFLRDPMYVLSSLDHNKLFERIAMLEGQVDHLQSANEQLVTNVSAKAIGKIDELESIIRQTGLSLDTLKQQAMLNKKLDSSTVASTPEAPVATPGFFPWSRGSQGGPFVPISSLQLNTKEKSMYDSLDRLSLLSDIISHIPLSLPIDDPEPQSNFGTRIDPFTGRLAFHAGMDMSGPIGSPIKAATSGVVSIAGRAGAYGNLVEIEHGLGITTRYGHMSAIKVVEGQLVKKGQIVGVQGSTGRSTGPHLHYEVRFNDKPMNPKNFLMAGTDVLQKQRQQ